MVKLVDLVLCEVLVYVSANQEEMINDFVSETRAVVEVMYESAWKDSCVRSTSGHVKKLRTKVKILADMVYRKEVREHCLYKWRLGQNGGKSTEGHGWTLRRKKGT